MYIYIHTCICVTSMYVSQFFHSSVLLPYGSSERAYAHEVAKVSHLRFAVLFAVSAAVSETLSRSVSSSPLIFQLISKSIRQSVIHLVGQAVSKSVRTSKLAINVQNTRTHTHTHAYLQTICIINRRTTETTKLCSRSARTRLFYTFYTNSRTTSAIGKSATPAKA